MRKSLTTVCLCLMLTSVFATNFARQNYINSHADLAVFEMMRAGIPASVKLAQGILETNSGNSTLVLQSNNHFGIKCKPDWEGYRYYHEDDDYENGKLIKSCFRSYDNVKQSYQDHSDFLRNNPRYKTLFQLDPTDYQGWAHGLKSCGYATAKDYAERLIRIIEQNQLYAYDHAPQPRQLREQLIVSNQGIKTTPSSAEEEFLFELMPQRVQPLPGENAPASSEMPTLRVPSSMEIDNVSMVRPNTSVAMPVIEKPEIQTPQQQVRKAPVYHLPGSAVDQYQTPVRKPEQYQQRNYTPNSIENKDRKTGATYRQRRMR